MYRMEIKGNAIKLSSAIRDVSEERGHIVEFESEEAAESWKNKFSVENGQIRISTVAPQDPRDLDGYLIGFPERNTHEPKQTEKVGLTFDVGANLYGEIGEALICGSYGLSPGIQYYFFEEVEGVNQQDNWIRSISRPNLANITDSEISWSPDCLIEVGDYETSSTAQYFCEVKTGDASFERNQVEGMERVAKNYNVLKIRVIIENLPEEYTVRINEVEAK